MKNHPHQNFNSPVKGKYNFNNINQYTIAELSYVIHKLRKRIVDKEKYITFLKAELEENNIEYKRKFINFKKYDKEDKNDFSIDPLLKHEKNIKKKIKKRRRKANNRDIHPEIAEPLGINENVTVHSFVNTLEENEDHSVPRVQANSEISTDLINKQENIPVEIANTNPMEEISQKIQEDLIREQERIKEENRREQEEKERRFKSELYLRKVRRIKNSNSLYKEILLGDREGIYSLKEDELDKLLSTTQEEEIQEELRRVHQKNEKTEDGSKLSVFREDNKKKYEEEEISTKKKNKVKIEEKKEEVVEKLQPVTGHRREEIEPPVYKQEEDNKESFIMALHRSISEEIEKDRKKKESEPEKKKEKEEEEEDEKEIDKILREEKEEINNKFMGNEVSYYLFSDYWKNKINNDEYRKKKINRMKKLLKEIEFEEDKEHMRKQIAFAKQYKKD